MINWKPVGTGEPDNKDKDYPGQPTTPFVPCLVWVCKPGIVQGGLIDVLRWDTAKKEWHYPDMHGNWIYNPELGYTITHFCDDYNGPHEFNQTT